jgi:hypothetical protein
MDHSRKADKEIEELKELLRDHIEGEEKTVHEILNEIKLLREQITPLVELWNNGNGFYKVFMWALKSVALLSAGIGAILFLKKL